jgi:hypothetical protein
MDIMTACNGMWYEITQDWDITLTVLLPLTTLFPLVVVGQASSLFIDLGNKRAGAASRSCVSPNRK